MKAGIHYRLSRTFNQTIRCLTSENVSAPLMVIRAQKEIRKSAAVQEKPNKIRGRKNNELALTDASRKRMEKDTLRKLWIKRGRYPRTQQCQSLMSSVFVLV